MFPLRPVGRCEGLFQLKKAHCNNAWPIAANAAICAYLHRAFEVIPEVDATSALSEFSRMRREGSTTRMKLPSTKLLCMPSSGEPDLVGVQMSTNGCISGDGPGVIAVRLFN